jgi:peptidoglycan/LPS O-acetylase OafA/YrhL
MLKKVYFPGLNGIRAIAAMIVIFFHIDQFSYYFQLPSIGFYRTGMAGYGVTLFFVLSGYLITNLLLLEKQEFNRIDLRKFYLRRIFRIWPIYYLIIIASIFIIIFVPDIIKVGPENLLTTLLLYSLLLSNIGFGLGLGFTTISPLWSIGVEEQFYLFWPVIINKSSKVLRSLFLILFIYLTFKFVFRIFENGIIYNIISLSSFSCMAIGGIGAYLVNSKSKYLSFVFNPISQIMAWSLFLVSIAFKPLHFFSFIDKEINSLIYIVLIVNVSANKKTIINLENKVFDFVGKISYGIYIYHMVILVLLSNVLNYFRLKLTPGVIGYFYMYFLVLVTTIIVATISYNYFESYFLKLKLNYSKIKSVNSRNNSSELKVIGSIN